MTFNLNFLLYRLWLQINQRRRFQLFSLLLLMLATALTEIISISAVLPFLSVLNNPAHLLNHTYFGPILKNFGFVDSGSLILPVTVFFLTISIFAGFMRFFLLSTQIRISHALGADFSSSMYMKTLFQPYQIQISRNSSEIISGISTKASSVVGDVLMPILTFLSSTLMTSFILLTLLIIEPIGTLIAFLCFAVVYALIAFFVKSSLIINSQNISHNSNKIIKTLQEGLGATRDVIIDGSQSFYCNVYKKADLMLRKSIAMNQVIAASPRYLVESFGIVIIALSAFYYASSSSEGLSTTLPVLGVFALGAQKLLPLMQSIYNSWSLVQGSKSSLGDVLVLLEQPVPDKKNEYSFLPLSFSKEIILNGIDFKYSNDCSLILHNINLKIPKGSTVGFIGKTGCGKSTLLDLIMGLLSPTNGFLVIDDKVVDNKNLRDWQMHIAHVPQSIYLVDATIAENIAFGVPWDEIDHERVCESAAKAQISQTIQSWGKKYETLVGERGVRLSGGQRQRIAIARALYKKADVIILDEATSALDIHTERLVISSIESLNPRPTILMVTHRYETLRGCEFIVELKNGRIFRKILNEEIEQKILSI